MLVLFIINNPDKYVYKSKYLVFDFTSCLVFGGASLGYSVMVKLDDKLLCMY